MNSHSESPLNLREFGEWVRLVTDTDLPPEPAALQFLESYPQYWQFVEPDSVAEAIENIVDSGTGFLAVWKSERQARIWTARANATTQIQQIALTREAARHGVDTPTMMQIKLMQAQVAGEKALMNERQRLAIVMMQANREHAEQSLAIKQRYSNGPDKRDAVQSPPWREPRQVAEKASADGRERERYIEGDAGDEDGEPDPPRVRRRRKPEPDKR